MECAAWRAEKTRFYRSIGLSRTQRITHTQRLLSECIVRAEHRFNKSLVVISFYPLSRAQESSRYTVCISFVC